MSLREDFRDVALELAKLSNEEKEKIISRSNATLKYYKEENQKRIIKRLARMNDEILRRELLIINKKETEQLVAVNQAISIKKGECVDDFNNKILSSLQQKCQNNRQSYFEFIFTKIKEFIPVITSDIRFSMNHQDLDYMKQNLNLKSLNNEFFSRAKLEEIETIGGFKIHALNNSFEINYTFEMLLEKEKLKIKTDFMKIFPVFEVKVKSARDVLREKLKIDEKYE